MKKKIFITLLSTVLMITLMPLAAFGAEAAQSGASETEGVTGATPISIAETQKEEIAESLAFVDSFSKAEIQEASIDLDQIQGQKLTLQNAEDYASREAIATLLTARIVPIVCDGIYMQVYFQPSNHRVVVFTRANDYNAKLKKATLQELKAKLDLTDEMNIVLEDEVFAEADAILLAKQAYFRGDSLVNLNQRDIRLLIANAEQSHVVLHVTEADLANIGPLIEDDPLPENAEASKVVTKMIDKGQIVADMEKVEEEVVASTFGSGDNILIAVCAGVFVLAGIVIVVIAKRKEKKGSIEVEVEK